jgi:superfamily II DNA or RNA helicase
LDEQPELVEGLHERLVTRALAERLAELGDRAIVSSLDDVEAYAVVARHVHALVARALRDLPAEDRERAQAEVVNAILDDLLRRSPRSFDGDRDAVVLPLRRLDEVLGPPNPDGERPRRERPEIPLSSSALLVNARGEPGVGHEVNRELASADAVDLLIPFVRWTGVRIVKDHLSGVVRRGGRVRVIASTYLGSTEPKALEALQELGAQVRVSYDTTSTRLHAKAWLFERRSGFSTALIGSSNLSSTALLDGLEWNVRLSAVETGAVLDTFRATFEGYWESAHVEEYEPTRFVAAIRREQPDRVDRIGPFDLVPYPHQTRILEQLDVERQRHGRWRNLVVAATGTGKTVVAALDYRRLSTERDGVMSLPFVAHRKEILEQSRRVFRHALRDGAFGEVYVDGRRPSEWRHVFASVQSLATLDLANLDATRFDMVIVDEFHHAAAPTYARLLDHLRPKVLLGLTATPERADGRGVTEWFGGRFAAEVRLWDAIEDGQLVPFQYFGVHDDVDLSALDWKRGGYDVAALEGLYTGNDARLAKVLQTVGAIVADPSRMRALGFCVSVAHAQYMAERFSRAGIPSVAVSASTGSEDRAAALRMLRAGEIACVFAVDLFNEGIDVPAIDTVLFLRPTESATVFLQQLGRGLRHDDGKACLTVLDFIGQQHRRFRFDRRMRALLGGGTRRDITRAVADGFPYLPSGCHIQLDRVAQEVVLDNLRSAVGGRWAELVQELRDLGDVPLADYLRRTEREVDEIYRPDGRGWSALRRDAGLPVAAPGEHDRPLGRAIGRLVHIDDPERVDAYRRLLGCDTPPDTDELGKRERRLLTMLHFDLWGSTEKGLTLDAGLARLWANPARRDELAELIEVLDGRADVVPRALRIPQPIPLAVHCRYTRDEALAAIGASTADAPRPLREGVLWDEASRCDLFFVTINKSERHYSPTTMYRDHAISRTLFHWESQSTTTERSATGQRYLTHAERGTHILLFARENRGHRAYTLLGTARYVSHTGERPIAITWRLDDPMPESVYAMARVAAA